MKLCQKKITNDISDTEAYIEIVLQYDAYILPLQNFR